MAWDDKETKVWLDGKFVEWKDANISVLSHVVHYGTSVFEGIRAYENENGVAVFRLKEHVQRLFDSAKIYKIDIPYTQEEIEEAILETVRVNDLDGCYIRPIVFKGYGELGVDPSNCPVNVVIAAWEWGSYLGEEGMANGVDIGVSSWRKPAPDTFPALAKCGANYMNSQLAKLEAIDNGYDEAIMLDYAGHVSEGSGENIFLVEGDKLVVGDLELKVQVAVGMLHLNGGQVDGVHGAECGQCREIKVSTTVTQLLQCGALVAVVAHAQVAALIGV